MAFLSLSLCVSLFFSLATVYIPTSGEEKTEQRGRKNEEICFDNGDALVMQMKLRRCRNFYVFFHAGQSKFFGSLSNRARSCTSAKSSTVEGWFYLFFFFFIPRIRPSTGCLVSRDFGNVTRIIRKQLRPARKEISARRCIRLNAESHWNSSDAPFKPYLRNYVSHRNFTGDRADVPIGIYEKF